MDLRPLIRAGEERSVDLAELRERLRRVTGTPNSVADALAAAGALAARGVPQSWPGPLIDTPEPGWQAKPLVRWRDPTDWLTEHVGDALPGERLDQRWRRETGPYNWLRVHVLTGPGPDPRPIEIVRALHAADQVDAVSVELPARAREAGPLDAGWSWPLRLAIGDGWRTGPGGAFLDQRSWWDRLTVPVPMSGRWAEASLALLPDGAAGRDPGSSERPVRASALVVRGDPGNPPDTETLTRLAERHTANLIAVVDPGPVPDRWIGELVAAISHDMPLDLALYLTAAVVGGEPPLVLGEASVLEGSRLRVVLAEAAARLESAVPLPENRPVRRGPVQGLDERLQRRQERGRLLRQLNDGGFLSEAGEASGVAEELAADRSDRRRSPDRFLLAELREGGAAARVVRADAAYELAVSIGASELRAAAGIRPFPAVRPESVAGTRLTVVVTDLDVAVGDVREAQQAELLLPRTGDSATLAFPVGTGPNGSLLQRRVAVLYGNRFLQTGILRALVGTTEPWSFDLEAVVYADVEELRGATPHDAALVLNHTAVGTGAVSVVTDQGSFVSVPDDILGSVDGLIGPLQELVRRPRDFTGFDSAAYQQLLIELARRGRLVREALLGRRADRMTSQQRALAAARRISVLSVEPDTVIPLEFLYDRPLKTSPGSNLTLCSKAREHLLAGDCPDTPPELAATIVCPVHFWAASKVLERHVVPPSATLPSSTVGIVATPEVERHRVPLGSVFAAAAARADHNDGRAWTTAAAAMTDVELLDGWLALVDRARQHRVSNTPVDVVLLVAHVIRTATNDIQLELGDGDTWSIVNDLEPLLDPDADQNPLMVVLGCGTAVSHIPLFRPPARLIDCGAPVVVASLVTVLGQHIVPVAVRLLEELRRAAADGGDGALLGDALLAARKACLIDGNAAVLTLAVFGSTDWLLEPAP